MAVAPSPRPTEPDPPSAAVAAAILNEACREEWGLLLWLTMITGPRRGEVSAQRWRHVDFERAILWVHRSNAQTKAGIKEKETKTQQRRRSPSTHRRSHSWPHIASCGKRAARASGAPLTRKPSSSPPRQTAPSRTPRAQSARSTAGSR